MFKTLLKKWVQKLFSSAASVLAESDLSQSVTVSDEGNHE